VRGKVQWVKDGVVGFETEKATGSTVIGSSVVPTDWEPDILIAVTNFPDMANATVNKWAMYKMVKIGIYNGYENQAIELYDCGKLYVPPPPKPLTPEQIATAKAKAAEQKKKAVEIALKSNQDAAAKGDMFGLLRMTIQKPLAVQQRHNCGHSSAICQFVCSPAEREFIRIFWKMFPAAMVPSAIHAAL
jgi:hypothetical protein